MECAEVSTESSFLDSSKRKNRQRFVTEKLLHGACGERKLKLIVSECVVEVCRGGIGSKTSIENVRRARPINGPEAHRARPAGSVSTRHLSSANRSKRRILNPAKHKRSDFRPCRALSSPTTCRLFRRSPDCRPLASNAVLETSPFSNARFPALSFVM
jgi:hypothetical protein